MKKIIAVIAVVTALTTVNAAEHSSRCCRDIYEAIERLLENKTITVKQAQELWKKHKNHL
jgi:hypothetical protein